MLDRLFAVVSPNPHYSQNQCEYTTSDCRILSCNVSPTLEEGIYMCLRTEFVGKYLEQEVAVGHSCLSRFRIKLREQT